MIQKCTKMTAMCEANSSLATKCLDFCQAVTSQGMEINFSLNIGSTFSFSLDTRHKMPLAVDSKKKKKASPSTFRRNAGRREEFLKKKRCPAAATPISSATASKSVAAPDTISNSDQQPTIMNHWLMFSSHLELAGNQLSSLSFPSRPRFLQTMFPVPLFVQIAEVVVIVSFQELTPSVVVDMLSLSHNPM